MLCNTLLLGSWPQTHLMCQIMNDSAGSDAEWFCRGRDYSDITLEFTTGCRSACAIYGNSDRKFWFIAYE